jgi:hypothetical protein
VGQDGILRADRRSAQTRFNRFRPAEKETMTTIRQIRVNRKNAPEGNEHTKFHSLVHGLRGESAVIPGEDRTKFDQYLERLNAAWMPQDDMEKSLVEQIAVNQLKLARLDRGEAPIYDSGVPPADFSSAIQRVYVTQARLERSISGAIADLERYRKQRMEHVADSQPNPQQNYKGGLIWYDGVGGSHYAVLPQIRGLDGVWREIPAELLADFPDDPRQLT